LNPQGEYSEVPALVDEDSEKKAAGALRQSLARVSLANPVEMHARRERPRFSMPLANICIRQYSTVVM